MLNGLWGWEGGGQGIEKAYFASRGSDTHGSPPLKRSIGWHMNSPRECPPGERPPLRFTAGWMTKQVKLPEQPSEEYRPWGGAVDPALLGGLISKKWVFWEFLSVVTIHFRTSVLYLYFLQRVAQWAELYWIMPGSAFRFPKMRNGGRRYINDLPSSWRSNQMIGKQSA